MDTGPDFLKMQLGIALTNVQNTLDGLDVKAEVLIGRVKSDESTKSKLENTPKDSVHGKAGDHPCLDCVGIRVIVKTDADMERILSRIKGRENILYVKDYVNNPRMDGMIPGTDPSEKYQSYHIFTDSMCAVPIEIQLRTTIMEKTRLGLRDKYGDGYWKTKEFRRKKRELGDLR